MIQIKTFAVNFLQENCHILSDETGEAVIVDCGAYFDEERTGIKDYIRRNGLRPVHHLLTHGHFDHVFGAKWLEAAYGLRPEMEAGDVETYLMQPRQIEMFLHRPFPIDLPEPGAKLTEGDVLRFGSHTLRVIATPGHTPGGVCFYCEDEALLLSGDSLFRASIGRCDFPGSNGETLVRTLRERVLTLPPDTRVLPGHGPETTIAFERDNNPYII